MPSAQSAPPVNEEEEEEGGDAEGLFAQLLAVDAEASKEPPLSWLSSWESAES